MLDAEILAEVYLAMTGGQTAMAFQMEGDTQQADSTQEIQRIVRPATAMKVVYASEAEIAAHETRLDLVAKKGGSCLWRGE
ncbi:DNA polymerase III subunit epsilon [compost metagenome]